MKSSVKSKAASKKAAPKKFKKADIEEAPLPGSEESDKKLKERIVTNVSQFWNAAIRVFAPDFKRAKENIGLVFDDHWDPGDTAQHLLQNRTALNMPGIFAKVQSLLGFEKNNREQFETDPKGAEDELTAQIFNWIFRHIEDNDDPKKYEYTKSDVFFDGIVPLCGVAEIYVETNDVGDSEIKLREIPYNEVVYEKNFTDVEMTGCERQQHGVEVFVDALKVDYPLKAAEIDTIPSEWLVEETAAQVSAEDKSILDSGDDKRKRCIKIRDWKLVNKIVYQLHCIQDDKIFEFYDKTEAEAERTRKMDEKREKLRAERDLMQAAEALIPGLMDGMTPSPASPVLPLGKGESDTAAGDNVASGPDMTTDEGIEQYLEEDYIIKEDPRRLVEHTVIAGNVVLEEPHILEVDELPLTFYFSIFLKGKVLTIVDVAKHLQQYFDKMFSQMDFDIGSDTKTTKVLYPEALHEDYNDIETALDAISNGDTIIAKGMPGQTGAEPVKLISRSGTSRDYFQIFELILRLMEDAFGGRNFQGAQEQGGGQSGKAIAKLQAAAALIALNYMDNLRRFDMQIGRKLVKYIKKFYTHKFALKVLGESLTDELKALLTEKQMYSKSSIDSGLGWVMVNDPDNPESRPLADANLSIVVKRVNVRQDEKDVEFEKLSGIKSMGYAVPVEAILDTMNVKPTLKQKIIKENEKQQAMLERQMVMKEKELELNANMRVAQQLKPEVSAEDVVGEASNNGQQ